MPDPRPPIPRVVATVAAGQTGLPDPAGLGCAGGMCDGTGGQPGIDPGHKIGCVCEDSFKVHEPPNAEARAKQFMDLSAEYLRVVPQRTKTPAYYTDSNPEALESLREGLLAHMLMRKFITKGESVYIPRVFDELLIDYKEQIPKPLAKDLRGFMHELSEALKTVTGLGVQYGINGADTVSAKVMMDSYLNGRLLHSDHDKWDRANADAFRIMLGAWTHMRVRFRDHLNASRHNVRLVAREHNLFSIPGDDPELD